MFTLIACVLTLLGQSMVRARYVVQKDQKCVYVIFEWSLFLRPDLKKAITPQILALFDVYGNCGY